MGSADRSEPIPAAGPGERKFVCTQTSEGRTHARGRGDCARIRRSVEVFRTRFFTGARVNNAVLGEFIAAQSCGQIRSGMAAGATTAAAHQRRTGCPSGGVRRRRLAQPRRSLVVRRSRSRRRCANPGCVTTPPAQETQNLGARAFDAVQQWHLRRRGKPRFKSTKRGLHSLSAKDGNGALRPEMDDSGRLVVLRWGAGFVIPIAAPA